MALVIELDGAQALLSLLERVGGGQSPAQPELAAVLAANRFFVDFYSGWTGVTKENLVEAMCRFDQADWEPPVPVLAALGRGFRAAAHEASSLRGKLGFLEGIDVDALTGRAAAHLPAGTPLDSTIHITIDDFNGGFQYQGEVGLSLLREVTGPGVFEPTIAHELHHVGFGYWAGQDSVRRALQGEESGRAVAVQHVLDLLAEGLAVLYCTPQHMELYRTAGAAGGDLSPFEARMVSFRRDERALLAEAERITALCLAPGADVEACRKAAEAIALDHQGIEPAGHYVGARMVETMSQVHSHERIVACVRAPAEFLPLYNEAARQLGGYVWDPGLVERFGALWSGE